MTSSIVNFLIEKYLCFFVEIDAKEIDASILNGTISLNNSRIKPSFFDSSTFQTLKLSMDTLEHLISKFCGYKKRRRRR